MSDEDLKESAIWELKTDLQNRRISPETRIKVIDKIREIERWEDPETIASLLEPLKGTIEALQGEVRGLGEVIKALKGGLDALPGQVVSALANREQAINALLEVVQRREAERSD